LKTHVYKPFVLESLAHHGLSPKPTTTPAQLRGFLNELYRYELRRLRDRYLRREFSKLEYHARVLEVRRRYPLMALSVEFWTE
jgi:hypothetical protein